MKRKLVFLAVLFASVVLLDACKDPDDLGLAVQPDGDLINVVSDKDFTITAYSEFDDSLRSDEVYFNLIGYLADDVFGSTKASSYFHIRNATTNVDFGTNPVCDSIVLRMTSVDEYGVEGNPFGINVFEVLEDFYIDSNYYTFDDFTVGSINYASTQFLNYVDDSVDVLGELYPPHYRMKLVNTLGDYFLNASASVYLTADDFVSFFKGLYVEPNSASSIISFDLMNAASQVVLYYHNDVEDSLSFNFVINDKSARVNNFDHNNYIGADVSFLNQLTGDTTAGDSLLYLQATAGVKSKIVFPDIMSLVAEHPIAVNKAELVVPVDLIESDLDNYDAPLSLALVRINDEGGLEFLPDELYGDSYFGGSYDDVNKEYRFRISIYMQNLVSGLYDTNNGMYLVVSGGSVQAKRVVINGSSRSSNPLRLEMSYTIVK